MTHRPLSERVEALEEIVAGLQGLPNQLASLTSRMDARFEQIDARFERIDARFEQLRQEVHDGDEETRRFMRILHEDIITRITALGDRMNPPTDSPPRS